MKTSNETINWRNEGRAATLRDLLEERRIVRAIEAHNGLTALVAEHAQGLRNGRVAHHLLRSAYPSMLRTAASILEHGRALEADADCLPIKDVIRLIEGGC